MVKHSSSEALLEAKLEASEAKLKVLELTQRVEALQGVLAEQTAIIKENTTLLRKQRLPPRPYLNSTSKALIACRQAFKCANVDGECPLFKLGDGTFQEDLWECDHINPWNRSGRHTGNIHALCSACHAKRTRRQIAERAEGNGSDTEEEDED
jgi:5-methylcytosine-specific restriction endonuclease McrA